MKVYALNTLSMGMDILSLISKSIPIEGVIGLSERKASDAISGYCYQAGFCEQNQLKYVKVESYALRGTADRARLEALEIDVLLVLGWQRLIPEWLINLCSKSVIGIHGSPFGINKGRGRSPQNWTLLLGFDSFQISVFNIDAGIDSGDVIETRQFELSEFDDIKTSYYKVSLLTSDMIVAYIKNGCVGNGAEEAQNEADAEYLPQRYPEDGLIDWRLSNMQIRNFVRALTRPYPGAYSKIDGVSIKIWKAIPFAIDYHRAYEAGTIVKIFNGHDLLIKTTESFVLVEDYEVESPSFNLKEGMVFSSSHFKTQFDNIIARHQEKHPQLTISKEIIKKVDDTYK